MKGRSTHKKSRYRRGRLRLRRKTMKGGAITVTNIFKPMANMMYNSVSSYFSRQNNQNNFLFYLKSSIEKVTEIRQKKRKYENPLINPVVNYFVKLNSTNEIYTISYIEASELLKLIRYTCDYLEEDLKEKMESPFCRDSEKSCRKKQEELTIMITDLLRLTAILRSYAGNARFFGIFEQVDNNSNLMFERAGDRILNYTNKLTDILTSGLKYGLLPLPFEVFDIMFDYEYIGKKYNVVNVLHEIDAKYKKMENFLIEMSLPVKKKGFFN